MTDRVPNELQPVGTPGLPVYAGLISDEWDKRLRDRRRRLETYREMSEADATVAALLFAFESLIRAAGHRVEPADESPQAAEAADFVAAAFDGMEGAWGDTLSEVLTVLPFGFALFEIVYRRDERGRLTWRKWSPRAQETIVRWQFGEGGEVTGAVQEAPPTLRQVTLPIERLLHFKARSRKANPEGVSILRGVFDAWFYKKHISRIEAIGIERDLAGLPLVRVPSAVLNEGGSALEAYKRLATDVRRDEQAGIVLPSDRDPDGHLYYDFGLVSTAGSRQIDTDAVIARYERLILRALLADFLTMGDTGVGSYAQSVTRMDLFLGAVTGYLESIAEVINGQAIARLCALNGIGLVPTFTFNPVGRRDVAAFAQTLTSLIMAGAVNPTDEGVRGHIYDVLGLPAPAEVTAAPREPADEEGLSFAEARVDGARLLRARALFDRVVDDKYRGLLAARAVSA